MIMNPDRHRLAACLVLAYTVIIVYASLQPLRGWRMPPGELFAFLTAAWPRYMTASDIALNVAAYLPLGALLAIALRPLRGGFTGCLLAAVIATLLSLALETAQLFLPARIPSNVDLIANGGGAALGALGVWLAGLPAVAAHPALAARRRMIRTDMIGDCGLVALAAWLFIQFDPAPLALASGDLRDALGLKPWFAYAPASYQNVETCIAALAILTVGLLAVQIATTPAAALLTGAVALALTIVAKSAAAWSMTRAANPLQWLTPGVIGGLLIGVAALALLLWLAPFWRSLIGIAVVLASVLLVNMSPENPYQSTPPILLASQPTHLSSFSDIVRVLAKCWPFAIIAYFALLARGAGRPPA
jgi:VanZ family protein